MVQLNLKTWVKIIVLLTVAGLAVTAFWNAKNNPAAWQSQVIPGDLSAAHASLKTDCAACHTTLQGVDSAKCIGCHADNESLVQRQPTAFHTDISNCAACHIEHQGANANLRMMNHEALARIGIKTIPDDVKLSNQTSSNPLLPENNPLVSPLEAKLDCASCHATKDKHFGLFGQNCASCHATTQWTIPSFQHPSPRWGIADILVKIGISVKLVKQTIKIKLSNNSNRKSIFYVQWRRNFTQINHIISKPLDVFG